MSIGILIPLAVFAFVMSATPGPNNVLLLASGANFGFRRTLPHMVGIEFGLASMIILMGLGLVQIFESYPQSQTILQIVSAVYLIYLAWKIARSTPNAQTDSNKSRPMTLIEAALFQWVNPKAWSMALSTVTLYAPDQTLTAILWVALIFTCVGFPSILPWALAGAKLQRVLRQPERLKWFNWGMAGLLVASLWPILRM